MAIPAIVVHGGAGNISLHLSEEQKENSRSVLRSAMDAGLRCMSQGGSAVEGVEAAVQVLEDSEIFNAARGAVISRDGSCQLSASMMDGKTRLIGACGHIRHIKHPISLARLVMNESRHVLMVSEGAEAYAKEHGLEVVSNEYFQTEKRLQQWEHVCQLDDITMDHEDEVPGEKGTVGAVAVDAHGNIAAGTSTGGMVNQLNGRIPDSAVGGAGTYASNETCGVSCTGIGEEFIRVSAAFHVHALMQYQGKSLIEAVEHLVCHVLPGNSGGIIALNRHGEHALCCNTSGMYRGYKNASGTEVIGIYKDE